MIKTFAYAYIQVALICLNTYQIANGKVVGALIVGFLISFVWCFNTQRISNSDIKQKLVYSIGATAGTGTGLLLATKIY